ncbi:MAG: APC family permease [Chloroflexi bacterium]|nr:APC family permease [Chloroflexota bacterium]
MSFDHDSPAGSRKPGDRRIHRPRPAAGKGAQVPDVTPPPQAPSPAKPGPPRQPRPGDKRIRLVPTRKRLRRALGFTGLFATGYGNVGSSIYYALGVTALFALGAAPIALTIAGILFVFTVLTYTEATVAVPEAGGASSFARHGLGEFAGFFTGWATLLSYTVTIAISAYTAGSYLSVFFPVLGRFPYDVAFGVGAIVFLMILNIVGIQEAAGFSIIFAAIDLLTQIVLVLVGGILLLNIPLLVEQIHFGVAPTWPNFFTGVAVAMVAYTGIETISNMAEETRVPAKTVPRSYAGLVFAVLVLFTGISTVALSAMPVQLVDGQYTTELATTYINDPVAGIAHKLPPPFSTVLTPIVGILASSILLIGANAGVIGVSRLSFSMGIHRQIPRFLEQVHPRFRTPYIAIILFCLAAIGLAASGSITQMAEAYIFAATLTFTMAHVALIGMRIRKPSLPRPFRLPFAIRIRETEIPLTAVIGGIGTFAVWLTIVANNPFGRWIGLAWLTVGTALFIVYRKLYGLPLNAPAPPSGPAWTREIPGEPQVAKPVSHLPVSTLLAAVLCGEESTLGQALPREGWERRSTLVDIGLWLLWIAYFIAADLIADGTLQWAHWGIISAFGLQMIRFGLQPVRPAWVAATLWGVICLLGFLVIDMLDSLPLWSLWASIPVVVWVALNWIVCRSRPSQVPPGDRPEA